MKSICKMTFLLIFAGFTSCKDGIFDFSGDMHEKLTRTEWKISSFVYTNNNLVIENTCPYYRFDNNGTFILLDVNHLPVDTSRWAFIDNEKYLQIGNNQFKIKTLTKRLLGLKYGNIEIFLLPANHKE